MLPSAGDDMARFPALMLWTDAWIADTHHLTYEQSGIYLALIVLMWRTPKCRVPNDDKWLAKHLHMTSTEVANDLKPLIKEFCQSDGFWITQKRLTREFLRAKKLSTHQRGRAKSRWDNKNRDAPAVPTVALPPLPLPLPLRKKDAHAREGKAKQASKINGNGQGHYAQFGSPELDAWDAFGRATIGRTYPRDKAGGWRFPTQWPPSVDGKAEPAHHG